jgi:hypothetical protein
VHNVNVALTRTLNKLRQEPSNTGTTNARSTPMFAGPSTSRPMTARITTHHNTGTTTASPNYYYQLPSGTKGPLPAELITRRPTSSFVSNILPNGTSHSRVSTGNGPLIVQQPQQQQQQQQQTTKRNELKSNENGNVRLSTPLRAPAKSLETGLHQLDGFNFDNVTLGEHHEKSRVNKQNLTFYLKEFIVFYLLDRQI